MKIMILDAVTLGEDISLAKLKELGEIQVFMQSTQTEAKQRIAEFAPDVVITNKVVLDESVLAGSSVKMIAETGTGYNNIDVVYAKAQGIRVANVAGYSTQSVIQHTFALFFYLYEKMHYYDRYVKSGAYAKNDSFTHFANYFHELSGKTWGIIGLGAIGRGVADIAAAFGCRVICYSASGKTYDSPYEQVDFDTLLTQSDVLSVHAPLNTYTHHILDAAAFAKMKASAVLINVGRGPIIDETDLAQALQNHTIAAAGLDVLEHEPILTDNPLAAISDSDRLIITPHLAWATKEARERLIDEVYENIKAFAHGKERNVIC